jgi:chemotaxis protein MotB
MADSHDQPIIIKKVKGGHGGHHGGAWKLAYADFVTAMMAFFLVMWIIGMDVKTKAGLAEYFSNPGAFPVNFQSSPYMLKLDGRPPKINALVEETVPKAAQINVEEADALTSTIRSTLSAEGVLPRMGANLDLRITDDGVRIDICESTAKGVIFEPGTADLKPEGRRLLQAIAPRIKGARKGILIEGHTARRGDYEAKWDVSVERANAARRELMAIGVEADRLISVIGKGDSTPKVGDNPASVANDRISIVIPLDKN